MVEVEPWAARPALLASVGAAAGLIVHALLPATADAGPVWRLALAVAISAAAVLFGFVVERREWRRSLGFALAGGAAGGLIFYWNGAPAGLRDIDPLRLVCAAVALAIAAPWFQARREGPVDYPAVHGHAWSNIVIWCAACLFTGIAWLMAWLIASLFALIGIDAVERLLETGWFAAMLVAAAFGGSVGLLREQTRIVRLVQAALLRIAAVLAPALAAALALFLLSLPFTGLAPLWEATKATTPILLACAGGALLLVNAVIGDVPEREVRGRAFRLAALLLALSLLPLTLIAAVSTGLRIRQYGLTPDRLWAVTFVAVAALCALAYLVRLILQRSDWPAGVRRANLRIGMILGGLALLMATPLVSFNAMSARDQEARLTSGRITPDRFDWAALAFDFGEPGRRALARLARSASPAIRRLAAAAADSRDRGVMADRYQLEARTNLARVLRVVPRPAPVPEALVQAIASGPGCGEPAFTCVLAYREGGDVAAFAAISNECESCEPHGSVFQRQSDGSWRQMGDVTGRDPNRTESVRRMRAGAAAGEMEVREVRRRQLFLGGEPVGPTFE